MPGCQLDEYGLDRARNDQAMDLLGKGTISRAGKAIESKGLGDLENLRILQQITDKHPVRIRQIGPDMYTFVPKEAISLKIEKIAGKLSNDAAP